MFAVILSGLWRMSNDKVLVLSISRMTGTCYAKDIERKNFVCRKLCERAGVPICKSPHCADCCDPRICFGPES
jgi:hypothetical protein